MKDFVDDDFEVAAALAFHEGTGAVDEFDPAVLDEGTELEPAAELVDNFVAFECFNHSDGLRLKELILFIIAEAFDGFPDGFDGFVDAVVFVDDHQIIDAAGFGGANFLLSFREASQDGGFVIASTFTEALQEVVFAGREDEDTHRRGKQLMNLNGALDVDFQKNDTARAETFYNRLPQGSVPIAEHISIL